MAGNQGGKSTIQGSHQKSSNKEEINQGQTQHRDGTKTAAAYAIWEEMHKNNPTPPRKDCIDRAISEAGMTSASANTIYQQWRSENGMVDNPEFDARSANHGSNSGKPTL